MNKFSVDYTGLQNKLAKKTAYLLSDVQHRIQKIAFDVVRFYDSENIDGLWQIQNDGDNEYIVAMYEDGDPTKVAIAENKMSSWTAIADNSGDSVNIFYKGAPITRILLSSVGIPASESYLVTKFLPKKLASDVEFRGNFIANLTDTEREALLEKDPSVLVNQG